MTKKITLHIRTSLQHLLCNKINIVYFTCDKLNNIFNICIYGFVHMNKLGKVVNWEHPKHHRQNPRKHKPFVPLRCWTAAGNDTGDLPAPWTVSSSSRLSCQSSDSQMEASVATSNSCRRGRWLSCLAPNSQLNGTAAAQLRRRLSEATAAEADTANVNKHCNVEPQSSHGGSMYPAFLSDLLPDFGQPNANKRLSIKRLKANIPHAYSGTFDAIRQT